MKGSEFLSTYAQASPDTWERAALDLARSDSTVDWPLVNVLVSDNRGNTGVVRVASDLFAVGTPDDFLRLPLLPRTAQTIANLSGYLLPTPKLAYEIWRQAETKLRPIRSGELPNPLKQNLGANLAQYGAHDKAIEAQRGSRAGLVTGHKKDIVISRLLKPGKVVIYGWFWPDERPLKEAMSDDSQPIQPRSNAHGDFYVDYSHGVRFVYPTMQVNGQEMPVEAVLTSPELSGLLSDEGPLSLVRYPASNVPATFRPSDSPGGVASAVVVPRGGPKADVGLAELAMLSRKR